MLDNYCVHFFMQADSKSKIPCYVDPAGMLGTGNYTTLRRNRLSDNVTLPTMVLIPLAAMNIDNWLSVTLHLQTLHADGWISACCELPDFSKKWGERRSICQCVWWNSELNSMYMQIKFYTNANSMPMQIICHWQCEFPAPPNANCEFLK